MFVKSCCSFFTLIFLFIVNFCYVQSEKIPTMQYSEKVFIITTNKSFTNKNVESKSQIYSRTHVMSRGVNKHESSSQEVPFRAVLPEMAYITAIQGDADYKMCVICVKAGNFYAYYAGEKGLCFWSKARMWLYNPNPLWYLGPGEQIRCPGTSTTTITSQPTTVLVTTTINPTTTIATTTETVETTTTTTHHTSNVVAVSLSSTLGLGIICVAIFSCYKYNRRCHDMVLRRFLPDRGVFFRQNMETVEIGPPFAIDLPQQEEIFYLANDL